MCNLTNYTCFKNWHVYNTTFKCVFQVQVKAISTLQSVFSLPDSAISVPYIHALCPKLIELIGQYATELSTQQSFSEFKLMATKELVQTLKVLVDVAANDKSLYNLFQSLFY